MTDSNFDSEIIDPDQNIAALSEAMGEDIKEEVTILQLLNGYKVKVRYLPQSIGASLEYDDGTPVNVATRKPKFNFKRWARETLPKMNDLALRNIRIVNDLDRSVALEPRDVRLSLISPGEFRRLNQLCFPGAIEDLADSDNEDSVSHSPRRKGLRGGQPSTASE